MGLVLNEQTVTKWIRENGEFQVITTVKQGNAELTYVNGILEEPMRTLNKKYWPFQFKINTKHDPYDVERWCYERFKSANWRNYGRMIAFKRQEDATIYALIWS